MKNILLITAMIVMGLVFWATNDDRGKVDPNWTPPDKVTWAGTEAESKQMFRAKYLEYTKHYVQLGYSRQEAATAGYRDARKYVYGK